MKFSHSQRVFHEINYNPSSNYYNIDKKQQRTVFYGTLAGPVLHSSQRNIFGNNQRFQQSNKHKLVPGPGQYFQQKKQIVYDFKKDLSNPKTFLKNTFRSQEKVPSIPYNRINEENLDAEDKVFLKQLYLIENPSKAAESVKKKDPSFSFAKSPRKLLPQLASSQKQKSKDKMFANDYFDQEFQKIGEEIYYQVPKNKLNQKSQESSKKKLILYAQTIKKAAKKRNQIINSISPDFVPSLELIDLMSKLRTKYVPGPGTYETNNNKFQNQIDALIQSNQKGAIFSSVKRFTMDKKDIVGPGAYNVNNESISKRGGLFAKQERKLFNMKATTDIEHRFYIHPDSQSKNQSSNQAQRSSSSINLRKKLNPTQAQIFNGFGSGSKRFSATSLTKSKQQEKPELTDYEIQKRNSFKQQLKARLKRVKSEDRRSTKEDSGLLGLSTMAQLID